MAYIEKMDALDLIIKTLKEHEKALDELTARMESMLQGKPETHERSQKWFPRKPSVLEDWR
jgi:hypothetical protein